MNPSLRYIIKCNPEKIIYLGETPIGKDCPYWIKGFCSLNGKCCLQVRTRM